MCELPVDLPEVLVTTCFRQGNGSPGGMTGIRAKAATAVGSSIDRARRSAVQWADRSATTLLTPDEY
jgi:hypothetical protein